MAVFCGYRGGGGCWLLWISPKKKEAHHNYYGDTLPEALIKGTLISSVNWLK